MKSPQHSQLTRALAVSLSIIPAGLILALILKYGVDVPHWDEWGYVSFFKHFSQGTLTLGELFVQHNEYRQFFPNLIFVGLGWLTKWDKRYELLVSFALACLVSFNVYRLGKLTVGNPAQRAASYFLANLLIFSPIQYENWLLGMQIIYFVPVACVTTCLVIAYSQLGARAKFLSCMCLATISTFSSANGILCWLVIAPLLLWPQSRRELGKKSWLALTWMIGFVASAAIYFKDYQKPAWHPNVTSPLVEPAKALKFLFILLGNGLELGDVIFLRNQFSVGHLIVAVATGLALAALFLAASLLVWRNARLSHRAAGWLMLGAYSIMSALLVTIGRAGFGVGQAFTTRYTTFTLYLTVALVHLLPIILERDAVEDRPSGKKKLILPTVAVIIIVSQLLLYAFSIRQMSAFSKKLTQSKACLLFINVVREDCVTEKVYANLEYLKRAANELDELGFLRPGLIKSNRVQDIAAAGAESPENYGSLTSVVQTGEDVYTVSGWAVLPHRGGDAADAILLTYDRAAENSAIFALADTGKERGMISRILLKGSPSDYARWQKSFSVRDLPANPVIITAWAFDAQSGKAFKLDGAHVIQKNDYTEN